MSWFTDVSVTDAAQWQLLLVTSDRLHVLLLQNLLFGPQQSVSCLSIRLPLEAAEHCFCCHGDDTRVIKITAERATIFPNNKLRYNYLFLAVLRLVAAQHGVS
jgi:hypothetical protein